MVHQIPHKIKQQLYSLWLSHYYFLMMKQMAIKKVHILQRSAIIKEFQECS